MAASACSSAGYDILLPRNLIASLPSRNRFVRAFHSKGTPPGHGIVSGEKLRSIIGPRNLGREEICPSSCFTLAPQRNLPTSTYLRPLQSNSFCLRCVQSTDSQPNLPIRPETLGGASFKSMMLNVTSFLRPFLQSIIEKLCR